MLYEVITRRLNEMPALSCSNPKGRITSYNVCYTKLLRFMVNQAIVDFWKSCNGQRKVTELVELFANQTGLQRKQVEKEVLQLLQQLRDGGLIAIAGQQEVPNVEFKK